MRRPGLAIAVALLAGGALALGLFARDPEPAASPTRQGPAPEAAEAQNAEPSGLAASLRPDLPRPGAMHIEKSEHGLTVLANGVRRGALLRALARHLDFVVVDHATTDPRIDVLARNESLAHVLDLVLADEVHSLAYDRKGSGPVALQRVVLGTEAEARAAAMRPPDDGSPAAIAAERAAAFEDESDEPRYQWPSDYPRLTAEDLERARAFRESRRAGLIASRLEDIASPDPKVRANAATRLDTENPDEFSALSDALLNDPSTRVRIKAARQMGFGETSQTLPVLEQALSDHDPDVVVEVIDAIEFGQSPDGIQALEPLRSHPNPEIRSAAIDAIEMLE